MSNFIGDRYVYNNPLVSRYNPLTESVYPYCFGSDTSSQIVNTNTISLSPSTSPYESWSISLAPRVRAFKLIQMAAPKPINRYSEWMHEGEWKIYNSAQKDFNFFIKRYKPYPELESGTTTLTTDNQLKINKFYGRNLEIPININKIIKAGVYAIKQTLNYKWAGQSTPTIISDKWKGFSITNNYNILISNNNFHLPLVYLQTTNPSIRVGIRMIGESGDPFNCKSPYQAVFDFLNMRCQRHFYRDVSRNFAGLIIPNINYKKLENTTHLNGMSIKNRTITNVLQYTTINMNQNGVSSDDTNFLTRFKENFLYRTIMDKKPNFMIDKPFVMWIESTCIPAYPINICMFNIDSWVKK